MLKGTKHSEETKKKWSLSRKGKNLGNTWGFKKAAPPWNKGKKTGFAPWLGKKRSMETIKKISDSRKGKYYGSSVINWKGDNVGYVSLHIWVARWKGQPKICENCGTSTAKKYEWANIDHKYRRVLEDYIRLCTSCHRHYDRIYIKGGNYGV